MSVRYATESEEDRDFVGKLMIEAFERKVIHATSRARERMEDIPPVSCCDMCGLWCLKLSAPNDYPAGKCYLDPICVDAKFRGKGIGKVLLDMAEIDAKKRGCKVIYLVVATTNRAQHLYERQGYQVIEKDSRCCCGYWCMTGEREFARMDKVLD